MKVSEIASIIEEYAPKEIALDFDNVGLLVGDKDMDVTKILVSVDVTSSAIKKAREIGANLIISHHPIIFYPMKSVTYDDVNASIISEAIKSNIALYAAHTNMDNTDGGITDRLLEAFEVKSKRPIEEDGTGRIVDIEPMTVGEIADVFLGLTDDEHMRIAGDRDKVINRFALLNGAGGRDESMIDTFTKCGVELYVTGEVKHSFALLLKERGIALIDIGHYHQEKIFIDIVCDILSQTHIDTTKYYDTNPYNS